MKRIDDFISFFENLILSILLSIKKSVVFYYWTFCPSTVQRNDILFRAICDIVHRIELLPCDRNHRMSASLGAVYMLSKSYGMSRMELEKFIQEYFDLCDDRMKREEKTPG